MVGDRSLAIAVRILRDIDLAEDAVQGALVTAWRELRTLRDPARFEPWLHRILTNACYTEARRRRRWSEGLRILPVAGAYGADEYMTVDDRDLLERAFRRSPSSNAPSSFVNRGSFPSGRRGIVWRIAAYERVDRPLATDALQRVPPSVDEGEVGVLDQTAGGV